MSQITTAIQSSMLGISVRGWIAIEVTTTLCVLCIVTKDVQQMKDVTLLALGYYFGQKNQSNPRES